MVGHMKIKLFKAWPSFSVDQIIKFAFSDATTSDHHYVNTRVRQNKINHLRMGNIEFLRKNNYNKKYDFVGIEILCQLIGPSNIIPLF